MNRYTIYCTEEQTKKALALGAPIQKSKNAITRDDIPHFIKGEVMKDWTLFFIPTAEQMIGWLEEQGMNFNLAYNPFDEVKAIVTESGTYNDIANIKWNKSKKTATIAAIDAALEYLENLK